MLITGTEGTLGTELKKFIKKIKLFILNKNNLTSSTTIK